ncbi:MAG: hypothetical protein IT565_12335 [Rhodospirillales bacterium]|nr:hypothetical protein [Rhodospirillales bacterium]
MSAICPRCDSAKARRLATAPADGAWEIFGCPVCFFTWRSSEPGSITDPKRYDPRFKIDPRRIDTIPIVPPVPGKRSQSS